MVDLKHRSVIIVTYKREGELVDSIQSLLKVMSNDDELIVVDQTIDHLESTSEFLSSLSTDHRVRLLTLSPPSVTAARNVGAREAKHEALIYVDDDVLIEDNMFLDNHSQHLSEDGVGAVAGHATAPNGAPYFVARGEFLSTVCGANMSFRRSVLVSLGGFDENLYSAHGEERECAERLLRRGWKIKNGPDCKLIHIAANSGGVANRTPNKEWYKKTYHNYCYIILKRPLWQLPTSFARYLLGPFRTYLWPGWKQVLKPRFVWSCLIQGHLSAIHTLRHGRTGPFLTDDSHCND